MVFRRLIQETDPSTKIFVMAVPAGILGSLCEWIYTPKEVRDFVDGPRFSSCWWLAPFPEILTMMVWYMWRQCRWYRTVTGHHFMNRNIRAALQHMCNVRVFVFMYLCTAEPYQVSVSKTLNQLGMEMVLCAWTIYLWVDGICEEFRIGSFSGGGAPLLPISGPGGSGSGVDMGLLRRKALQVARNLPDPRAGVGGEEELECNMCTQTYWKEHVRQAACITQSDLIESLVEPKRNANRHDYNLCTQCFKRIANHYEHPLRCPMCQNDKVVCPWGYLKPGVKDVEGDKADTGAGAC